MKQLISMEHIQTMDIAKPKTSYFYLFLLFFLTAALVATWFIKIDISVKTQGITRPSSERAELKSQVSGEIEAIYYKEGDLVQAGSLIMRFKRPEFALKKQQNDYELNVRNAFIHDLLLLTQSKGNNITLEKLTSPVYKQQLSRYFYQRQEYESQQKKIKKELEINSKLLEVGSVSQKDVFDRQMELEHNNATFNAFQEQQINQWQQELDRYTLERSQFTVSGAQMVEEGKFYELRAPVNGRLQQFNHLYKGNIIQAGQPLGTISPESELLAECYFTPQDIGLIKTGQVTKFQVDAFDYNYFGILTGKISNIDHDFTIIDNKPMFKVQCSFDSTQLHLKNGFKGDIKKGMTLQARCLITERTIFQLFFDKINDWLNPT